MKKANMPSFSERDRAAAQTLIRLGLLEDLGDAGDLTTQAMVPGDQPGGVAIVARGTGVVAGLPIAQMVFAEIDPDVQFDALIDDGGKVSHGSVVAIVRGSAKSLLTGERTALNFLTHLSGIATLTARFVAKVEGTKAQILDTRKTHPGYRLLEKYAVRCGGGVNHRIGLYDGVMIKDNHIAAWTNETNRGDLALAIREARELHPQVPIEIEVDTLEQLEKALPGEPDFVLLDNMPATQLEKAVQLRNRIAPNVLLEASGGINLDTVSIAAQIGVDRISIGALTHSAVALDLGFDWGTTFEKKNAGSMNSMGNHPQ